MNNTYQTEIKINSSMVDVNNKLRFDSILNIFQDLSTAHATEMGMGFHTLKENSNAFWVLSKIRFTLNNSVYQTEQATIKTWPLTPSAYRFIRDFKITSLSGEVLGSSEWCILDWTTNRLRNFSTVKYPEGFNHLSDRSGAGDFLRVNETVNDSDYNHTHKALFTDIDCNGHVNNVAYAKMALNTFTPEEFENHNFKEFEIHFISQSYYGNEIKIYKKGVEKGVYVEGKLNDKTIFKTTFIK